MKKKILAIIAIIACLILVAYFILAARPKPAEIEYGVSFNTPYAYELKLDWKEIYNAILTDLNVNHLRLSAHWNLIEPEDDKWNFAELDYQVQRAKEEGADVIFGVGKRLPRWPECHVPEWAWGFDQEKEQEAVLEYIEKVVDRYKGYDNIVMWQVENEAFLSIFAKTHCEGFDPEFLEKEIALVKSIDPTREVLLTDSADLGSWIGPYKRSDAFGISVYVYVANPVFGPVKNLWPASWYRMKSSLMEKLFGKKEIILAELSLEPWLLQTVVDTPIEQQLKMMDVKKINEVLEFAERTRLQKQYLWGAEWWYYMKLNGHPEFWERAKEIF